MRIPWCHLATSGCGIGLPGLALHREVTAHPLTRLPFLSFPCSRTGQIAQHGDSHWKLDMTKVQ